MLIPFLFVYTQARLQECPDTCHYFIPNTLTPDCDQAGCEVLNVVSNCSFTSYAFTLYNKWAEGVFHSASPENNFDCTGHENGIYTWKLSAKYCNSKLIDETGIITILN